MNFVNRFVAAVLLVFLGGLSWVSALEVSVSPGGLQDAVGDGVNATALKVSGSVDVRDFEFISGCMQALQSLDLGGVSIAAYNGASTSVGCTSSPANTLPECALMGMTQLRYLILPRDLEAIADGALGGSGIEAVAIPDGVRSIGLSAFAECASLKAVSLPSSVSSLGAGAFKGCVALETVVVSAALTELPAAVFKGCRALAVAQLPSSVTAIGDDAFNGCAALGSFSFPASLTAVGSRAFYGTGLSEAVLNRCPGLKSIGRWAFACCPNLASVEFSDAITEIGEGAFYNDAALTVDALPGKITKVSDFALRGIGAADGEFLSGTAVDSIGAYAMANWANMQKLVLPGTLEYIGDGAMANWTALEAIVADAPVQVPALGDDVWRGVRQEDVTLFVASSLEPDYRNAPQWKEFKITSQGLSTNTNDVMSPENGGVTACFEGMTLLIESPVGIAGVELFDVQGRMFRFPVQASDGACTMVDTSGWDAPVMIVRVALSDGTSAIFKLSR